MLHGDILLTSIQSARIAMLHRGEVIQVQSFVFIAPVEVQFIA